MDIITLNVETREKTGKLENKRLRNDGAIPAVVYSEGKVGKLLQVNSLHFEVTAKNTRSTQLFKFKSGTKDLDGITTLIKSMQMEPVKERVTHIDFLELTEGHRITIEVGIELVGESPPVKSGDSILNHLTHEIEIECLPTQIPESIKVDISALVEGSSIHAGDLVLPEGIELISDRELTIVSVIAKREEVEAPKAEEAVVADAAAAAAAPAAPGKGA